MRSTDENISLLSRAILNGAQEEAEQILIEAKENSEAILQRGEEQATREREKILERAQQSADRIRSQAIASTQLKARTMELESREKQLERVFEAARNQLQGVQQRSDFPDIARALLRDGLVQMKANKVIIRADPTTMKQFNKDYLGDLSRELKVQIEVGEPLDKGIGVIIDSDNKRIHYDNTLDNRLNQLQYILRAPVHHLLMGEQL